MVGEGKDWQAIFNEDIEKTNELQRQYQELIRKFEALKKHQISHEKRKQIDALLTDIRIKLDRVRQIDEKQVKILMNYCGNYLVNSLT